MMAKKKKKSKKKSKMPMKSSAMDAMMKDMQMMKGHGFGNI